jgi:hypothetical protein
MRHFILFVAALLAIASFAQDPPKKANPASKSEPTLKAEDKAAILEIQLRMSQEQNQYVTMQAQEKELADKFTADKAALLKAQDDALKNAGADDKDYSLNLATLKIEKKPPAVPQAAPAKKP